MLTETEERELVEAYVQRDDQKAFMKILFHFLPLIHKHARRFIWQRDDFEDLIQEGTFALSQAIQKFDPSRGNRLAPFAEKLI